MVIQVRANTLQQEIWQSKNFAGTHSTAFVVQCMGGDICFDLLYEDAPLALPANIPVFVHAPLTGLTELPANCHRIIAWPGFLDRPVMEIAFSTDSAETERAKQALNQLGFAFAAAPDQPGLIAARVIAMIINEAYFALGDQVSTPAEIDTAMKLGTNYPYGPFEWGEKIGLLQVYQLLDKLAEDNSRYAAAPALKQALLPQY